MKRDVGLNKTAISHKSRRGPNRLSTPISHHPKSAILFPSFLFSFALFLLFSFFSSYSLSSLSFSLLPLLSKQPKYISHSLKSVISQPYFLIFIFYSVSFIHSCPSYSFSAFLFSLLLPSFIFFLFCYSSSSKKFPLISHRLLFIYFSLTSYYLLLSLFFLTFLSLLYFYSSP